MPERYERDAHLIILCVAPPCRDRDQVKSRTLAYGDRTAFIILQTDPDLRWAGPCEFGGPGS